VEGENMGSGLPILIKLQFILLQYLSPHGHMEQPISFNSGRNIKGERLQGDKKKKGKLG